MKDQKLMAELLVLLLLLAVPLTAFTTTDVYYVTSDDATGREHSCPLHQICHNLSYYISQPNSYFTSDTTIVFLEGEHSFDDFVNVSNVHNLTLKGQGQWPVAGAEETVMQSTVILTCIRGSGGFYFATSHNITVEGLTIVNCGRFSYNSIAAVMYFNTVNSLVFRKNSIQHMTGYGSFFHNCDNATITNSSYYHSAMCKHGDHTYGGGVGIEYETQYSNTGYTLELSHSNMTKCCNYQLGGGLYLITKPEFPSVKVLFSHLVLSHNTAVQGGGLAVDLLGDGNVTLIISNCVFFNGTGLISNGGIEINVTVESEIIIQNTNLVENIGPATSEIHVAIFAKLADFSMLNSTIVHTETYSNYGVWIQCNNWCSDVKFINTKMRFAKLHQMGLSVLSSGPLSVQMNGCQFEGSRGVPLIVSVTQSQTIIKNCKFSNNTGGLSVIKMLCNGINQCSTVIYSSIIADNKMTGITLIETRSEFIGRNVIQNNRNTEGAGIILSYNSYIQVEGQLYLYDNVVDQHGGAILVLQSILSTPIPYAIPLCSLYFNDNSSSVTFSGNKALKGGSDMYGATLMGCGNNFHGRLVPTPQ